MFLIFLRLESAGEPLRSRVWSPSAVKTYIILFSWSSAFYFLLYNPTKMMKTTSASLFIFLQPY